MAAAAGGGGGGNGTGSNGASAGGRHSSSSGIRRMSLSLDDLPELDATALPHLLRAHVPRSQSMCDRREGSSAAPAADGRGGSGGGGGGVWNRIRRRRASFSVGSPSGELGTERPHRAPWSAVAEEEEEEEGAAPAPVAAAGDDKGWLRDLVGAGRNWRGIRIGGGKDRQIPAALAENGSERGWLRGKMGSAKGRRASLSLGNLREMRENQEGGEGNRGDSSRVDDVKPETGGEWREISSSFNQRDPWKADLTHKLKIPASLTHVSLSPHVWSAEGEQTDDGACTTPGSIASQARRPVTPRTPLAPADLAQHAGVPADGLTAERNGADPRGWRGGNVGNGQAPGVGRGRAAFPRNASVDSGRPMDEGAWEGLAHACLFPGGSRVAHWPEETSLETDGMTGGSRQIGLPGTEQEGGHIGWGSGRGGKGGCEERQHAEKAQQAQLYQQFDRYMPYGVQQRQQQQRQQVSLPRMSPSSHALSESWPAAGRNGVNPPYPDIMR
ncbi:unnamed protein product [Closterium sp. NIES-65]|nr:unnamed protein product [Closterium sp. NIES-65]